MKRRDFLQLGPALPTLSTLALDWQTDKQVPKLMNEPEPTPAQLRWMDLKLGLMVHFGINTYYDAEWSDGTLGPNKYNPQQLDTDQWCRAAQAAGMKYLVFVTKHHDGFCNWPTKFTDYCVRKTPYKKDVLHKVAESAEKYNLKLGLYYSLWDRHEKSHDQNEQVYVDFMKKQLEELLTQYGPVVELWFDGFWKKQRTGWTKKDEIDGEKVTKGARDEAFIQAWRMEGAYRWQMDHLYQFIKDLQPDCMVANNSTTAYPGLPLHPVDIRPGEKATQARVDQKIWNWLGKDIYLPMQIETTLSVKGNAQFPSGNWFWHESDHSIASREQVANYQAVALQMQANLLLNVGPMANGKLRPEDEKLLHELHN
jgi:alpha-L-fucosidase